MSSDNSSVVFKGTKAGLIIILDEDVPFEKVIRDLNTKLEDSGYFFVGAEVTLDIAGRVLARDALKQVLQSIEGKNGLRISGLRSKAETSRSSATALGIPIVDTTEKETSEPSVKIQESTPKELPSSIADLQTDIIRRTLRSGQRHDSDGNLVILGDVNPGAEVTARGDIIVFGTLRGTAFAGAYGKEDAIILALKLSPTQLRIADRVGRSSGGHHEGLLPEYASIEGDNIVIAVWKKQ